MLQFLNYINIYLTWNTKLLTVWVRTVTVELHSSDELFVVWAGPGSPTSTSSTRHQPCVPGGQSPAQSWLLAGHIPSLMKDVWQVMSPVWCTWWVWFMGKKADQTQWKAGHMTRVRCQHFAWRIEESVAYFFSVQLRTSAAEQTARPKATRPYLPRRGLKWKGLPGSDFLLL